MLFGQKLVFREPRKRAGMFHENKILSDLQLNKPKRKKIRLRNREANQNTSGITKFIVHQTKQELTNFTDHKDDRSLRCDHLEALWKSRCEAAKQHSSPRSDVDHGCESSLPIGCDAPKLPEIITANQKSPLEMKKPVAIALINIIKVILTTKLALPETGQETLQEQVMH